MNLAAPKSVAHDTVKATTQSFIRSTIYTQLKGDIEPKNHCCDTTSCRVLCTWMHFSQTVIPFWAIDVYNYLPRILAVPNSCL
jgi:hypothetical protein